MQEYRPYRAPLHLPYHFIILMRLPLQETARHDTEARTRSHEDFR